MASSQERLWGLQDSPQFSWQGNPGWVLGCQGCLAALPCPRVTSNGQLRSQLALTWVSVAVPDMVLGPHDRLQPSRHRSPPCQHSSMFFLRQVGLPPQQWATARWDLAVSVTLSSLLQLPQQGRYHALSPP